MRGYLIAFGGKPLPGFLDKLEQVAAQNNVVVHGAVLTDGPGCSNLAVLVDDDKTKFVEHLTIALMPAKYEPCNDPELVAGLFKDLRGGEPTCRTSLST